MLPLISGGIDEGLIAFQITELYCTRDTTILTSKRLKLHNHRIEGYISFPCAAQIVVALSYSLIKSMRLFEDLSEESTCKQVSQY